MKTRIDEVDLAVLGDTVAIGRQVHLANLAVLGAGLVLVLASLFAPWQLNVVLLPTVVFAAWRFCADRRGLWAAHQRRLEHVVARAGATITESAKHCYAIVDLVLDEGWDHAALCGALGLQGHLPPTGTARLRDGRVVTCSVFHEARAGTTHLVSARAADHDLLDLVRRSTT